MDSHSPPHAPSDPSHGSAALPSDPARWWLWPNLLSLDAPLVAVAWLWLMATTLSVQIPEPAWCYGILASAVWVIYIADRLLDGMSVSDEASLTARHRFYRNHRLPFALLATAAATFAIWAVLFHAPSDLFRFGVVTAFVSVFYLMQCAGARLRNPTVHRISVVSAISIIAILILQAPYLPQWMGFVLLAATATMGVRLAIEPGGSFFQALPKEIFCGFTFAIGVSLPVLVWSESALADTLLLGVLFSLNCISIALYEHQHDSLNDPVAITKFWPRIRLLYPLLITGLAILAAALAFMRWENGTHVFPAAVASGAILLCALHALSHRLGSPALRVLADLALLLPPAAILVIRSLRG